MGKLEAVLRLTRAEHSAMLAVAVTAAELLVSGLPSIPVFALSLASPILISMASFAINDYFDIKVDKLNRKNRPLVTGELKPAEAIHIAAACFVLGVAASALINAYAFGIALLFAVFSFLYSYRLKETLLAGNIYIAFTMAIPFIFGNYVVSATLSGTVLVLSAMVFLSGLAREVHGTIRDYRGDVKARKAKTLPRAIGVRAAAAVAFALYLIAIAISAYLFLSVAPFMLNLAFGAPILASDLMLLYVASGYLFERRKTRQFYDKTRNVSLIAMGLALIAIAFSVLVHT